MADENRNFPDMKLLEYFAVAAEQGSLRRAAEKLFMAQPPLSRHMKRLEEQLGLALFARHTRGLTLTAEGARVLEIIRPLLRLRAETGARLRELCGPPPKTLAFGVTTAFEQGIFSIMEERLRLQYGPGLRLARKSSPRLAREVRNGRLHAALVALPLDAPGLAPVPLSHAEPLMAALPGHWPEAARMNLPLCALNGKNLFWFRREANPAFFDYAMGIFSHAGFFPAFIEEPAEYDVLLARIAAGEGLALLPESFSSIRREGVAFASIAEGGVLQARLGLIAAPALADSLGQTLLKLIT